MNWGTKIVIGMAVFMAFIVALGARMILSDKDDLVEKDYYERGMNYDEEYNSKKNAIEDRVVPVIAEQDSVLHVKFPGKAAGQLLLKHAQDKNLDRSYTFTTDDLGNYKIPVQGLSKGLWRLRFSWSGERARSYRYDSEYIIR